MRRDSAPRHGSKHSESPWLTHPYPPTLLLPADPSCNPRFSPSKSGLTCLFLAQKQEVMGKSTSALLTDKQISEHEKKNLKIYKKEDVSASRIIRLRVNILMGKAHVNKTVLPAKTRVRNPLYETWCMKPEGNVERATRLRGQVQRRCFGALQALIYIYTERNPEPWHGLFPHCPTDLHRV